MKKQIITTLVFTSLIATKSFAQWGVGTMNTPIQTTNGYVGIGTASPLAKLTIWDANNTSDETQMIRLGYSSSYDYRIFRQKSDGVLRFDGNQTTFSGYRFSTSAAANALSISNNGNIGVGTATPDKMLTINSSVANTQIAKFADNARYIGIGRDEVAAFDLAGSPANLYLGGAKLNILTTGEVGVGITTPYKKLTVNGDAALISSSSISALEIVGNGAIPARRGISLDSDPSGKFNFYIHGWQTNASFNFKNSYNDANLVSILVNGSMVVGNVSTPTGYKLFVETGILTEKVKVALKTSSDWADYVFANDYKLNSLKDVDTYITANKHLPGVPSAAELVENGGFDLGKMDAKLLEKIEELTLYIIQLDKTNKELAERLGKLESNK